MASIGHNRTMAAIPMRGVCRACLVRFSLTAKATLVSSSAAQIWAAEDYSVVAVAQRIRRDGRWLPSIPQRFFSCGGLGARQWLNVTIVKR